MSINRKMHNSERNIFSLIHGISGMMVAVILLLSILGILTYFAIVTQRANAESFYSINQDLNVLKMKNINILFT